MPRYRIAAYFILSTSKEPTIERAFDILSGCDHCAQDRQIHEGMLEEVQNIEGPLEDEIVCPTCEGSKTYRNEPNIPCHSCNGEGRV